MAPVVVNGWSIHAHPIFLDQLEGLIKEVEERKRRDPNAWQKKTSTKRLTAIFKLAGEVIPTDPGAPPFRQGGTLGEHRKHWFRAIFFQRYRLFYRFKSDAKVIVLAWVNGEKALRACGSKDDAYATFQGMPDGGRPPDDFDAQMKEAAEAAGRFEEGLKAASLSGQG